MEFPKIRNHSVIEELGQGRTGPVYKGIQESLQREVAIKIMSPKLLAHAVVVKEFLDKARSAASLSHPNIISIYNVDQEGDGVIYYTMEYLSGGSLEERIRKENRLSPVEATKLVMVIARGLEFGQKKGALHGNLKPSKVLFMEEGSSFFKLSGFGLLLGVVAKHSARHPTPYTAPEVIETERPPDFRADIFALGAIYYQMVTGEDCFSEERGLWKLTPHELQVTPPSQTSDEIPEELDELVLKMIAFKPDDRPQGYSELYEPLGELLDKLSGRNDKKGIKAASRPSTRYARSLERESPASEKSVTPSKGVRAVQPLGRARKADEPLEPIRKRKEKQEEVAEREKPGAREEQEARPVAEKAEAVVPAARPRKSPIFQIILTLFSLAVLAAAITIAYPRLSSRDKDPTGRKTSPPSEGPKGGTPTSVGSGGKAGPGTPADPGSKTGTALVDPRKAETDLKLLENPVARVSELVRICADPSAKPSENVSLRVPQHVRRFIVLARGEYVMSMDEGKFLEALAALTSLHDNHMETDRQKEYARGLLHDAILEVDRRFEAEVGPIQKQVESNQLLEAKEALQGISERYKAARWQEKAQERVQRINQLLQNSTSDGGSSKKELEAVLEFKKVLDQTRGRVQNLVKDYRYNLAAQAYDKLVTAAPNDKLKQQIQYLQLELQLQAELFQKAAEVLKAKGPELKIFLTFGVVSGNLAGVDEEGLALKHQDAEVKVRYNQVKPDQLAKTFFRLPMGSEGFLCLAAFCYANNLNKDGDKALERALTQGGPDEKKRALEYQAARDQFFESGSVESGVQEQVNTAEAKDLYLAAIYEMALGQDASARAKLQTVIEKHPDSSAAKEAQKLLEEGSIAKIQEEGKTALSQQEEKPGKEGMTEPGQGEEPGEGESGPSAGEVTDADKAYEMGMEYYKKALPGMPNRAKYNDLAFKFFTKSLKLYTEIEKKDPNNEKLKERMTQISMLRYGCMKSKTLK